MTRSGRRSLGREAIAEALDELADLIDADIKIAYMATKEEKGEMLVPIQALLGARIVHDILLAPQKSSYYNRSTGGCRPPHPPAIPLPLAASPRGPGFP